MYLRYRTNLSRKLEKNMETLKMTNFQWRWFLLEEMDKTKGEGVLKWEF
jgi:hypothetical protein